MCIRDSHLQLPFYSPLKEGHIEILLKGSLNNRVVVPLDVYKRQVEGYLKIPVVMGRSNMAGYNQDDIEEMKIRDGLTLHELSLIHIYVSMEALRKICTVLDCNIADIVEFEKRDN